MDQFNMSDNVDTLFRSLEDFTQKEGVIGKPVIQGDKTFLPVVSVTIGYGGGNAAMKGTGSTTGTSSTSNTGSGALGLGAKLNTEAVILIENQNVSMLPMSPSNASQLVDKIPQIITNMNQKQPAQQSGAQAQ
jgi:uncharacterized spore protein YtfJ